MAESEVSVITWIEDGETNADVYASEEIALGAKPEFSAIKPDENGDRYLPDGRVLLSPRPVQTSV